VWRETEVLRAAKHSPNEVPRKEDENKQKGKGNVTEEKEELRCAQTLLCLGAAGFKEKKKEKNQERNHKKIFVNWRGPGKKWTAATGPTISQPG